MKKSFLLILLLAQMYFSSLAQSDTSILSVTYEFGILTDTTIPGNFYKENMLLLIGQKESLFKSYDKYLLDSIFNEKLSKAQGIGDIKITPQRPTATTQRIQEYSETNFLYGEALFSSFYYWEEAKPVFNWQIEKDTITLSGLLCQKAVTRHKGRNWEVWFCPDMPFPVGPWKFYGLPGLILQANDSRNQVYFKFNGFISISKNSIQLPIRAIKTEQKEFVKIKNAALENPEAFINNSGAFSGTFKLPNIPKPIKNSNTFNDPIELE